MRWKILQYGGGGGMQIKIYLKNAAILTLSGLVLRVLGMAFRVFVAACIG